MTEREYEQSTELSPEELEEQQVAELPDREAMSVVSYIGPPIQDTMVDYIGPPVEDTGSTLGDMPTKA